MSYELFLNGSTAEIIITILISLIVTLAVYCAIPLLIASFRKTPITRKKYRHICFAANILPLLIFVVINGSSSGGPYLIWTTVFAGTGSKKLAARGLLINGRDIKKQTTQQTEVTKMSLSPANGEESPLGKTYGSSLTTGDDIRLDPSAERLPITPSQPPKNSTPVTPAPASAPGNQRFCKYCGGATDPETKQCTSCGKQFFNPKASSNKLIITMVVLVVLLGISCLFVSTYNNGIEAMNNQQFILAQQYFDKLVVGKSFFHDEYEYIEAGVLMETGEYIEAYRAFSSLKNMPISVSILNNLKDQIYSTGVKVYDSGDFISAKEYFTVLEDYGRSADFLFLISCKSSSLKAEDNYTGLLELIDFKDTNEIILNNPDILEKFLLGWWEDGSTYPYYFEIEVDDDGSGYTSRNNLPHENADGYFYLSDGNYAVGETEATAVKYFKFSIIDKDTISVYCYKDGSTHRLHCVKRYEPPKANDWGSEFEKYLIGTVFTIKGSELYHKFGCHRLEGKLTDSFPLPTADNLGFQPCPDCSSYW